MTATVISGINLCPRHRVRCCCAAERKRLNAGEQAFKESRRLITVGFSRSSLFVRLLQV